MEVVLVSYDDWAALYINGKAVCQQHEITLYDLQEYVPETKVKDIQLKSPDEKWFYSVVAEIGNFPEDLEEVKF